MQIAKSTPGPWIVDDRHVHPVTGLTYPNGQEPETDVIVLVDTDHHDNGLLNETDKANLRLIAAAPDLMEACEETERALSGLKSIGDEEDWEAYTPLHKALSLARAAIAKAGGAL